MLAGSPLVDKHGAKYPSPILDTAPGAVQEESNGGVQQDVTVEVFMGFVQHAAIVTGVNVVPPTILGGINVKLWHAHQAHLLIVGVALNPTHPVASREATKPHDAGAQPEVHRTALVGRHHCLLNASVDLWICGGHLSRKDHRSTDGYGWWCNLVANINNMQIHFDVSVCNLSAF